MANKFKKKKQADAGELKSLNTQVDFTAKATAFHGINTYGVVMVGDRGIEYYNERTLQDFIQIPWEEINYIVADVAFGGKWIPRFEVQTFHNGNYRFSAGKDTKPLLRACREHVPADHMTRALSAGQKLSRGLKARLGK